MLADLKNPYTVMAIKMLNLVYNNKFALILVFFGGVYGLCVLYSYIFIITINLM